MSSREYSEWRAYYQLEPFGEERADLRIALLDSIVANSNRDTKKQKRPYKPEDFMLKFDRQPQTAEQQLSIAEMLNEAFGGIDVRKKS